MRSRKRKWSALDANAVSFKVVIPARYGAGRLPGKPLIELAGRPMIQHVYERAIESGADEVVLATDDSRIAEAGRRFGADIAMTAESHPSGTDRIAEVIDQRGWPDEVIVVNLQGDEPLMSSLLLAQVAVDLADHEPAPLATLAVPLAHAEEWRDPNVVKVVRDRRGFALTFSRAPIPYPRDMSLGTHPPEGVARHLGLYAYRARFLRIFAKLKPAPIEDMERLEQLRALWYGARIHVADALETPIAGVDTIEDAARVAEFLRREAVT